MSAREYANRAAERRTLVASLAPDGVPYVVRARTPPPHSAAAPRCVPTASSPPRGRVIPSTLLREVVISARRSARRSCWTRASRRDPGEDTTRRTFVENPGNASVRLLPERGDRRCSRWTAAVEHTMEAGARQGSGLALAATTAIVAGHQGGTTARVPTAPTTIPFPRDTPPGRSPPRRCWTGATGAWSSWAAYGRRPVRGSEGHGRPSLVLGRRRGRHHRTAHRPLCTRNRAYFGHAPWRAPCTDDRTDMRPARGGADDSDPRPESLGTFPPSR